MHLNENEIAQLKTKLTEELGRLEKDLSGLGHKNPDNPSDWEPSAPDLNIPSSDENDRADSIEEFEENTATLKQLEIRYNLVKKALEKIGDKTYGIDEVDGGPIPIDRLHADPAARTKIENVEKV